ncbi:MAG: alpha/beta fold hydrolase [Acidobacteria bacterium]|nr:alpha/beta fold hydrolase [Acidobacteriota bacterium]
MTFAFETRDVQIDSHSIHYLRAGAGEPLLLVHGITTYSFIWREVLPLLAGRFDVIAVDLLGCGDSDKPLDVPYSLKAHAERVARFIEVLAIGPVHYAGHDLGGGIGQIVAVRHPELLRDLMVFNTVAYDFWPVQPITSLRTPIMRELLMAAVNLGAFELIVKRGVFHKERVTPALMESFMKPLQTPQGRKAFLHFAHCLDNHDLTEIAGELRRLQMPVLIVRGDADVYLRAAIAQTLHEEIPGSRLVRVASAGHFIQEDEPHIVAESILDFLGVRP